MTVSGMKRSMEDMQMQVDSDVFTAQTGTSVIQSINECVRYKKYFYSRFEYIYIPFIKMFMILILIYVHEYVYVFSLEVPKILPTVLKNLKLKPWPFSDPSTFPLKI